MQLLSRLVLNLSVRRSRRIKGKEVASWDASHHGVSANGLRDLHMLNTITCCFDDTWETASREPEHRQAVVTNDLTNDRIKPSLASALHFGVRFQCEERLKGRHGNRDGLQGRVRCALGVSTRDEILLRCWHRCNTGWTQPTRSRPPLWVTR